MFPNLAENEEMPVVVEIIQVESKPLSKVQFYAFQRVSDTWDSSQWDSFNKIVESESNWIPTAQNPNSSAHGLCQFLSATYEDYGEKTDDPKRQIDMCVRYIKDRYETPDKAWQFWLQSNWY